MSLFSSAADWLDPKRAKTIATLTHDVQQLQRQATDPIPFHISSAANFGPGIADQPSHATLINGNRGIAETATRAIAARVSSLNPLVKTKRTLRDGTVEVETLDDHPLKELLDHPNKDITRANMFRLIGMWVPTVGESYWYKVKNRLNVPFRLDPIPPGSVTPLLEDNVVVAYSLMQGDGRQITVEKETVVRFYFPNPANPWSSKGYLAPEGVTADSLNFSGRTLKSFYEHDATPKTVLETTVDAVPVSDDEKKRFGVNWKKLYHSRNGTDKGVPGILPAGYKLIEMALQSGADIVPLLEFWRDEQLMGFGTPRSVLGQSEAGDRSTAETNQYVFDRHAVKPIANLIADAITLQLAPDFDPNIFVEFEEFVSADKEFELKQEDARLRNKVVVINEVRKKANLEKADYGDEPVGTFADVPYRPEERFELEEDDPEALGDRSLSIRDKKTASLPGREVTPLVRAEWERQVRRERKFVPAFQKELKKVFKAQQLDTIKNLYAIMPRARVSAADVFDPDEWVEAFEKTTEPIRVQAFTEIATDTLSGIVDKDFVFTESMQKSIRKQGARMIQKVNDTTKDRIANQLRIGTAKGESVDQIAKRVRGVFKGRSVRQSRTIARTEVGAATSQAHLEAYDQSGVVEKKQWNTAVDVDVRDTHAPMEGVVVGVDETFTLMSDELGTEEAEGPRVGAGGGSLSAGNQINCRCFMTPVIEE